MSSFLFRRYIRPFLFRCYIQLVSPFGVRVPIRGEWGITSIGDRERGMYKVTICDQFDAELTPVFFWSNTELRSLLRDFGLETDDYEWAFMLWLAHAQHNEQAIAEVKP